MLEQCALMIRPWTPATAVPLVRGMRGEAFDTVSALSDPEDGSDLGFAGWRRGTGQWLPWLARQSMQVFETEDASLLMTLYRSWGLWRTWQVCDAEERRVGMVFRTTLWDAQGMRLAHVTLPNGAQPGRFVGPRGAELATLQRRGDGTLLLTFSGTLEGDPFVKMTLLGATLLLQE